MTYELSLEVYAASWFGLLGTLILMANWIEQRLSSLYSAYVDRVDRMNGDLGFDRSVDVDKIAWDFLIPFQSDSIKQYAKNNDYRPSAYGAQLRDGVGRPIRLIGFTLLFGITVLFGFAGPLVLYIGGESVLAKYIGIFVLLFATNLIAYFIFRP